MATGYHGTSVEAAQRILSGRFAPSRNEYDWLGDGAYFFEERPRVHSIGLVNGSARIPR